MTDIPEQEVEAAARAAYEDVRKTKAWLPWESLRFSGRHSWHHIARAALEAAAAVRLAAAAPPPVATDVMGFARAVLHGDDVHRAWLLEAAEAYVAGKPLPNVAAAPSPPVQEDVHRVGEYYADYSLPTDTELMAAELELPSSLRSDQFDESKIAAGPSPPVQEDGERCFECGQVMRAEPPAAPKGSAND